ncbi:MAG: DUF2259 domain-containing protein [Spirochaetaceae bacterium]|jgi:predicted secreted protein|nr:DUF2259 domain-containing protein [Spirochaetaceae bacterium]
MIKLPVIPAVVTLLLLSTFSVAAGDVASFVDLGFSKDGGIYVFAQYGVEEKTLRPWADLNIVNVPLNDFVPGGRFRYTHSEPIGPVQDGSSALMQLIASNSAATKRYGLDFFIKGVPIFISLKNTQDASGETIEFRDFQNELYYRAELVPQVEISGGKLRSSFYINLIRSDVNGISRSYTVGAPSIKRAGITSYSIKRVLINPQNTGLIFVIEMTRESADPYAPDIRYMVEALKF